MFFLHKKSRSAASFISAFFCVVSNTLLLPCHALLFSEWAATVSQAVPEKDNIHSKRQAEKNASKTLPFNSEIVFSNGKKIRVGNLLGAGGTSVIYEIIGAPGEALRLPSYFFENQEAESFLNDMIDGNTLLDTFKVNKVKLLDSLRGEYIIVSRLNLDAHTFTENDFKTEIIAPQENSAHPEAPNEKQQFSLFALDQATQKKAAESLIEMAKSTAAFEHIGDFRTDQLHYSPQNDAWTLADWAHSDTKDDARFKHTLFDPTLPYWRANDSVFETYLALLGLKKNGHRLEDFPAANSPFKLLTLEERIRIATDIDSQRVLERVKLSKEQEFIEAAKKYPAIRKTVRISLKPKGVTSKKCATSLNERH